MKKWMDIVVTLCALVCGVFLLAICRSESIQLQFGIEASKTLLPMIAAILNLIIFAVRVIGLFVKGKAKSRKPVSVSDSKLNQFIDRQQYWVEDWCEYMLNRIKRIAYLTAVGIAGGFFVLALFTGEPINNALAHFLPIGLIAGECFAILLWLPQKGQSKPGRILKKMKQNIESAYSNPSAQEDFANDMLNTGNEWVVQDRGKDTMLYGIVGSRYWAAFSGNGGVTIVTPFYLRKIATAVESGSIRVNKVRTYYQSYGARFYYQNGNPKVCDSAFSFESEDGLGLFMVLVRKRVGDSIEITAE